MGGSLSILALSDGSEASYSNQAGGDCVEVAVGFQGAGELKAGQDRH
jgi:hypothetical protein